MQAERWLQIDGLLDEALALPLSEREAFLAHIADEELRREVASLLKSHDQAAANFLNQPALEIAAQKLAQQEASLIGQRFGSYQILSVLGAGGMGEVYLARDERLGRSLALKLLPAHYVADASRVERFTREARAVSALNHPNIVTVYDIGERDGIHYLAMEHVDGQTLRTKLHAAHPHKLEEKEVVEIALQIAAALRAAHETGIVHRDIKPENVMVRRDGFVKVLDFGLAKLTDKHRTLAEAWAQTSDGAPDPQATRPGTVLGTVRYMSPEQAQGRDVDARSDIFSLGIVLYELLAGSPPFKGDSPAAVLDAVIHHAPLPLSQLCPGLDKDFERIVFRMLEKDRDLRYQTTGDLCAELKRLKRELDSAPTHSLNSGGGSGSSSGAVKPPETSRTRRLALAAAVVLAAIGFAVWRFWPGGAGEPSPWLTAYSSQLTDFPGEERDPSLSPDGKVVYYARRVQGQWDIFWQRVGGSNPTNLTKDNDADDSQPAVSPDGASVVFRSERHGGGLFVMGATGENVRPIANFGHNPAWSPDGKQIVCGTDYIFDPRLRAARSRLLIINLADGQARELLAAGDVAQPRWSPGGQRIAYYFRNDNKGDVWTIAANGSDPRPVTDDTAVDWNPVWSSDGKFLHFNSNRKAFASLWRVRIDETTGRRMGEPEAVTSPTTEIIQADIARDGRCIVYSERRLDLNLKALDFDPVKLMTTGKMTAVTEGTRPASWPTLSPDGQSVAYHTMGAAREDIWITRTHGDGTPTNLTNDASSDRSPSWSPDGKRLAFFSSRNGVSHVWLVVRF